MTRQIALLRGINLGGHNRIAMPELTAVFVELGCTRVATYLQSGNVVFDAKVTSSDLSRRIEEALKQRFDYAIPVITLTAAEFKLVTERNPFMSDKLDRRKLHVTFLAEAPSPELVKTIDPNLGGEDQWQAIGAAVYLYCPNGYGRTKLTNGLFERKFKTVATTRNWQTVTNLLAMASADH